jgi:hypothetical protein
MDAFDATLELDRPDALTGARVPLRARVRARIHPPVEPRARGAYLREALEGAVALGQQRFGLLREEMPARRGAIEAEAHRALDTALQRAGHRLEAFALLDVERADPGA